MFLDDRPTDAERRHAIARRAEVQRRAVRRRRRRRRRGGATAGALTAAALAMLLPLAMGGGDATVVPRDPTIARTTSANVDATPSSALATVALTVTAATTNIPVTNAPSSASPQTVDPAPTSPETPLTSAAPTDGLPAVLPCGMTPSERDTRIRPAGIVFGCATGANVVGDITWNSWTETTATGVGTQAVNDCTPSCAEGTFHHFPVTIQLSDPGYVDAQLTFQKQEQSEVLPQLVFRTATSTPTSGVGQSVSATGMLSWGWTS